LTALLTIPQSTLTKMSKEQLAQFTRRCSEFMISHNLCSQADAHSLEHWVANEIPSIERRGFVSERSIMLLLALNHTQRCDVLELPELKHALFQAGGDESSRIKRVMDAMERHIAHSTPSLPL
jgi:hypothetical protein